MRNIAPKSEPSLFEYPTPGYINGTGTVPDSVGWKHWNDVMPTPLDSHRSHAKSRISVASRDPPQIMNSSSIEWSESGRGQVLSSETAAPCRFVSVPVHPPGPR